MGSKWVYLGSADSGPFLLVGDFQVAWKGRSSPPGLVVAKETEVAGIEAPPSGKNKCLPEMLVVGLFGLLTDSDEVNLNLQKY